MRYSLALANRSERAQMIDIRMWGRALNRMPKLTLSEWQVLDPVAKWLIACRASVLFMDVYCSRARRADGLACRSVPVGPVAGPQYSA